MDYAAFFKSLLKIDLVLLLIPTAIVYGLWLIFNERLEINHYVQDSYKFWIHLIGLLSLAYTATIIGKEVLKVIKNEWAKKKRIDYLKDLSTEEKELLQKYILKERKTITLPLQDGVVQNLENREILYRSTTVTRTSRVEFDFTIQQWAWEYLKKRKELISIPRNE